MLFRSGGTEPYFSEISKYIYLYNHTRWGFGGSMDYKPSDNSDIFVHGIYTNFKDYGQKYGYDIVSAVPAYTDNQGNYNAAQPGGITYSTSVRRPNYLISDYWLFALEVPPPGYEWVRDDGDALLVDTNTGEILQVEYGVFG